MNAPSTAPPDRLNDLLMQLSAAEKETSRRTKALLCLLLALGVGTFFSLQHASGLVRKLDPDTVASIGRYEIEKHMPSTRDLVSQSLSKNAPQIVGGLVDSLEQTLPGFRDAAEKHLAETIDGTSRNLQEILLVEFEKNIEEHKARINESMPNKSDVERIDALIHSVTCQFSDVFSQAVESLYPRFDHELKTVEKHLDQLTADEKHLMTERERTQAEIIEILLCLILRGEPAVAQGS